MHYYTDLEGHLSRFNIEVRKKPSISEFINIALYLNMISPAGSHLTNTHQYPTVIRDSQVFYY